MKILILKVHQLCKGDVTALSFQKKKSHLSPIPTRMRSKLGATSGTKKPALWASDMEKSLPWLWEPDFLALRDEGQIQVLGMNPLDSSRIGLV